MRCSDNYAADFETTTDVNDCRVWAYSVYGIESNEFLYGNSLDDFMEWCKSGRENKTCYFHNLSFDGEYILNWLFLQSFTFIEDLKERQANTFTCLIDDSGKFYKIEVFFYVQGHHTNKVTFLDSFKIFPNFSVDKIAKSFGLPIQKLKIDYHEYREVGHELTDEEIAYIKNDVEIVARALKMMFELDLNKMTLASDALTDFKNRFNYSFRKYFPKLETDMDADIRKSYRGGFTCVSDKYKGKVCGAGYTLDVNSLYPSVMACVNGELMPYGMPIYYEGQYQYDPEYPLYVQTFTCKFKLKSEKIPCIQLKNTPGFIANEWLKDSDDEQITLTLTNPDFELFMDHYDIIGKIDYLGGWKFKGTTGLFDNYINHWTEEKIKAGKEGNKGKRQIAKLMLNSLYGKFGTSPENLKKVPVARANGSVGYVLQRGDKERNTVYIPVAAFVTAYGRNKTIRTAQFIRDFSMKHYGYDAWIYSDTDSQKIIGDEKFLEELSKVLDIDDYKLGYWAVEEKYEAIKCIRQKCYVIKAEDKLYPTVAGLPKFLAPIINFDNFHHGFTTAGLTVKQMQDMARQNGATEEEIEAIHHKTTYKHVAGGVVLVDTDFTIK